MATERDEYVLRASTENIPGTLRDLQQLLGVLERLPGILRSVEGAQLGDLGLANINQTLAALRNVQAAARASIPLGEPGAFPNEQARAAAVLTAERNLAQATQKAATVRSQAAAQEQQANVDFVRQQARDQAAYGRRVQQTELREAEERRRVAQARRDAEFAFTRGFDRAEAENLSAAQRANAQIIKDENAQRQRQLRAMRADAEAAFGARPGSALFGRENALTQERIDQLLAPGFADTATTSAERVQRRRDAHLRNLSRIDEEILTAQRQALAGTVSAANSERRLAALAERRATAAQQLAQANDLLLSATRRDAMAAQRAAIANQGPFGRAGSNFMIGFRGGQDVPYMQQIGQAFKFSTFYGAAYRLLFGFTQTLEQTLREGIEFEQAMTDLTIATGRSREEMEEVGERLGAIATEAGAAPSQAVQLGARAIGLYGVSTSSLSEQERIAEISARVVSRLAVGSPTPPVELQAQIAAITQALGSGAAGQFRVADLDAWLTKRFGAPLGSTFQAVAQSASIGKAAGFTDEEIFAIAANMISRTGQTPSAVGGFLAQLFSRGGEGVLTGVAERFGIDTATQDLAAQLRDLAAFYQTASPNEQNLIAASVGRGKIQNAIVGGFFSDFDEVMRMADEARTESAGAADEQFNQRMEDIGGQVNRLQGEFREFAYLLGDSGLLDTVGLLVRLLTALTESVNGVLSAWNDLPGLLRTFAGALAAASVASRLSGRGGIMSAAGAAVAAVRRPTPDRFLTGYLAGQAPVSGMAAIREGSRNIGRLGAAAVSAIHPMAYAVAGLLALGALKSSGDRLREAQELLEKQIRSGPGYGATSAQFSTQATALSNLADDARDRRGGFMGRISSLLADPTTMGGPDMTLEARARALAERYQEAAERALQREENAPIDERIFTRLDDATLKGGLDGIAEAGGTAAEQLAALRDAIHGMGDEAADKATVLDVDALALSLSGSDITEGIGKAQTRFGAPGDFYPVENFRSAVQSVIEDRLQEQLPELLEALNINSMTDLTPQIIEDITSQLGYFSDDVAGYSLPDTLRQEISGIVAENLRKRFMAQFNELEQAVSGATLLSDADVAATLSNYASIFSSRMDMFAETDFEGRLKEVESHLRDLQGLRLRAEDPELPQLLEAVRNGRELLVQTQIDRLQRLRQVAEQNAETQEEVAKIGMPFVRQMIQAVVEGGGSADQLAVVLASAGKGAIDIARETIQQAIQVAQTAENVQKAMQQAAAILMGVGFGPLGIMMQIAAQYGGGTDIGSSVADLESMLNQVQYMPSDVPAPPKAETPKEEKELTPEELAEQRRAIAAARRAAEAARRGGEIAAARAALANARAELRAAARGSLEYYQALESFYQAQSQLTEAMRNYANLRAQLRIDITDPVAMARNDLQQARRRLREDRRAGRGRDVIAQDQLDVRNAEIQLEAERFQQRLSDVQTAEQLGRISHLQYIRYLENEHNRLERIKNRTRQQQEQLNQIDQLMLEAARSMEAQWNFGDIKLPTPYQIRRFIQEEAGGRTVQPQGFVVRSGQDSFRTTTIYINGADVGMVKQVIADEVGKPARVMTVSTRRL